MTIACIPADNLGNKLWIKEFRVVQNHLYLKYKSTYNAVPFVETEVFIVDDGKNCVITGDNGVVLYRFGVHWLNKISD